MCLCTPPQIVLKIYEPNLVELGMYILTPKPTSTVYFINPSYQSVYSPIVARQWLCKNVTAATNTHVIELLDQ
jgi:hypothetical protein